MKTFNTILHTLSLLLLLLLAGQVAQATTKTVTYTLDLYTQSSYTYLRLTHSGDTPFDGTTTVESMLFTNRTSAYFSLPDGFNFYFGWGNASSLKNNSTGYYHDTVNLEYSFRWGFLDNGTRYYVTKVQLTDANGNAMKLDGGGTASTDYDYSNYFENNTSTSYKAATGNDPGVFKKLIITYSDVPELSIFEPAGTNTYKIRTFIDLRRLADYVNIGHNDCNGLTFIQTANITWDSDLTYTPIGYKHSINDYAPFSGTYDGQGRTLRHITVNTPSTDNVGIFGFIQGGTVQGIVLEDCTFTGRDAVGGIVGESNYGTVRNCWVKSSVAIHAGTGNARFHGGIVGNNDYESPHYPQVLGCVSAATISNDNHSNCTSYGGIVGANRCGQIRDCLYIGSPTETTITASGTFGSITGYEFGGQGTYYHNNYYIDSSIGAVNGSDCNGARKGYIVTLYSDNGFLPEVSGATTQYNVSGLTAIGTNNCVLRHGAILYSGEGQNIPFSYSGTDPTNGAYAFSTTGTTAGILANKTLTMTAADVEVFGIFAWTGSGSSAEDPYLITHICQMNQLAIDVNSGLDHSSEFFALGDDLIYDHSSAWNATASDENNYTPIGGRFSGNNKYFKGSFDGRGHTVSGIRIYNADGYAGLFGYVGTGGAIRNLTLTDARITGKNDVGGIAGDNAGTLVNCHVTATVCIHGAWDSSSCHGGIAGYNERAILACTSSATLSLADGLTGCNQFGGIAGTNWSYSNSAYIQNCLVVGATLPAVTQVGAIAGSCRVSNSLSFNLFRDCSVDGTPTDVGFTYNDNNYSPTGRAEPGFLLSVGEGLTASPAIITTNQMLQRKISYDYDGLTLYKTEPDDNHTVIVYNGTSYYGQGAIVDLDGASNIQATKTADGTDVTADVISGTELTMPAYDVTLAIVVGSVRAFLKDGHYWATYYNGSSRKILPAGATAYTMDSNKHLYRLGTDGSVIPAGVAVVIMADSDTIELTSSDDTSAVTDNAPGGNILRGSDTAVTVSSLYGIGTPYVLGSRYSTNTNTYELGFLQFSGKSIPANRAYYVISQ